MLVGTWNSQGYKFGDGYVDNLLKAYDLDALCIQECGNLSHCFTGITGYTYKNEMYIGKRGEYHLIYYPWRSGCRCSMAVMVKDDYKIESATLFEMVIGRKNEQEQFENTETDDGENELRKGVRPIMRVRISVGRSSVYLCNTHLPSGCPSFARRTGYMYLTGYKPRDFILMGDMNSLPHEWHLPSHLKIINAGDTYPWDRPDKCYDYCITDIAEISAYDVYYPGTSDHLAAVFEFDTKTYSLK